jgi:hypothetical protein
MSLNLGFAADGFRKFHEGLLAVPWTETEAAPPAGYLENNLPAFASSPSIQPVHRELRRRLEACRERRRAAALSPGNDDDFAVWCREVRRGGKLTRALTNFLRQSL